MVPTLSSTDSGSLHSHTAVGDMKVDMSGKNYIRLQHRSSYCTKSMYMEGYLGWFMTVYIIILRQPYPQTLLTDTICGKPETGVGNPK